MRLTLREVWDLLSTTIVTLAAVAMVLFYLHDRSGRPSPSEETPTVLGDWKEWGDLGIKMGPDNATIVVATFTDFNCPFCRDLVPVLDSLRNKFPNEVAIEHHHFPLGRHEFAVPSAVAAECADRQGRFVQMYHALFSQMDSIGSRKWESFAADADVPDLPEFAFCIQSEPESFPRIAAGLDLGKRIGVRSTPTIWINGELFRGERSLIALQLRAEEIGLGVGRSK